MLSFRGRMTCLRKIKWLLTFVSLATQHKRKMAYESSEMLRGICNKRRCLTQQCCTLVHDSDNVTFLFEQRVSNFWREIKTIFVEAKIASIRFCPRVVSMERILNETILLTEIFFCNKSSVYMEKKLCKLRLKIFFEWSTFGKEIRAKTDRNLFLTNKGFFEINFQSGFCSYDIQERKHLQL